MCNFAVTPLVGVWIEIIRTDYRNVLQVVTPLVGVWIEITTSPFISSGVRSLPSWECGLKFYVLRGFNRICKGSLPSWECGLKFCKLVVSLSVSGSLPSWECGLKYHGIGYVDSVVVVTPLVGVWIEIFYDPAAGTLPCASLPSWECGLKLSYKTACHFDASSLPSWECGLK